VLSVSLKVDKIEYCAVIAAVEEYEEPLQGRDNGAGASLE